jgi:hypothetical protein
MNFEKIRNRFRGWLPKEPIIAHAFKMSRPRWRKSYWIVFTSIAVVGLAVATYTGVQTYRRYSDPQLDVTAGYYEKTLNCTSANVGDVVEVYVLVGWHGHVIPEFKREVSIVDPYFESSFELVGGNNTYGYSGYGGGDQFTYLLKVIGNDTQSIEMPKPRLYLDGSEISLNGTNAVLEVQMISGSES